MGRKPTCTLELICYRCCQKYHAKVPNDTAPREFEATLGKCMCGGQIKINHYAMLELGA